MKRRREKRKEKQKPEQGGTSTLAHPIFGGARACFAFSHPGRFCWPHVFKKERM
jgi:hypothetical protein